MRFIDWCIKAHADTNHYYDQYLPYEFHLRMTMQVAKDYNTLVHSSLDTIKVEAACAGHDLLEDTRKTYNDVFEALCTCDQAFSRQMAHDIVEIIFAVSNETGRNRAERANDHYYSKILNTPLARFVKLCDRIANVRYSVLTKSPQLEMYRKEHAHFIEKMELDILPAYRGMVDHLEELLKKEKVI